VWIGGKNSLVNTSQSDDLAIRDDKRQKDNYYAVKLTVEELRRVMLSRSRE